MAARFSPSAIIKYFSVILCSKLFEHILWIFIQTLSVNNGEMKSCNVPTVTPIVYIPAELKSPRFNNSMSTLRLDGDVWHRIKLLWIRKGFRGHRSRRRKIKQKNWNTVVHLDLLRPLSRRLIDYSVDRNSFNCQYAVNMLQNWWISLPYYWKQIRQLLCFWNVIRWQ